MSGSTDWNKLEITKICVSILTPIAVAILGAWLNFGASERARDERHSADKRAEQEREAAGARAYERDQAIQNEARDRDVTKKFVDMLSDKEICKKPDDVFLIISLATTRKSEELSSKFATRCQGSDSDNAQAIITVNKAVAASKSGELNEILNGLQTEGRRTAREQLKTLFDKDFLSSNDRIKDELKTNSNNYRVMIGILYALDGTTYNWKTDKDLINLIANLRNTSNAKDATFLGWIEKALN